MSIFEHNYYDLLDKFSTKSTQLGKLSIKLKFVVVDMTSNMVLKTDLTVDSSELSNSLTECDDLRRAYKCTTSSIGKFKNDQSSKNYQRDK